MQELKVWFDEGIIDISIIERYEKKTGYKFPKAYKKILSKHNGLHPKNNNFIFTEEGLNNTSKYANYPESDIVFLRYYENPTVFDSYNIENYLIRDDDNALKPHTIIFGENGGGDYIAFDYSDNLTGDSPKIVFIYHDETDGDTTEFIYGYAKTEFIANSFEEFIDMLFEFNEEEEIY